MYYVGLDLHKKYITGCVLDSQGAVVAEQRRLPPVLETLLGWLAPVGQPVAVALEATLYWAWLHDRLTAAGYQVAVAHPQQVKLICHARCKTDPVDARKLADLLLAEIGTIARFGSSHELAAYAGLVPSTRSSGGKTAHGSVGPAGSAWLKWLFVEAVQTLKRQPGPVRSQYERLLRAKGKPKATVAAARKLCCYVYWMMKEGRSYDDWLRQRHQREVRPIQAVASVA